MRSGRVDRKLLAIVAMDVAGYSRLMEADEAGTHARLRAVTNEIVEPRVAEFGGRIVKSTGDGLLIEFPSTVAAVECTVAIQTEVVAQDAARPETDRLVFRAGINVGDVIVEGGDLYGDGINVAARLQAIAEPGGIVLSEGVKDQIEGKITLPLANLGPLHVKNIARPIHAWRWCSGALSGISASPRAASEKPGIAVLPFENMSGEPEQEYFADGMTEEIITLLSSVPDLFVIARNSTYAYKGRSVDVRKVAHELGVRYVLEGSVRRAGDRIRVTAQFIEAGSGQHVWAERYDRSVADIFQVQDEVAQGIVGALQARLILAEARLIARMPPAQLDAWGCAVNATLNLMSYSRDDIDRAEPYARRSIAIDPNYALGHSLLGHILAWRTFNGWTDDWLGVAQESVLHCDRATALAGNDASVLTNKGFAFWYLGRFIKAASVVERAYELNPNSPMTSSLFGVALAVIGRTREGIEKAERALLLSPKDPLEHLYRGHIGYCHYFAGDFQKARIALERAIQLRPGFSNTSLFYVATLHRLGELENAREALRRAKRHGVTAAAIENIFRPRTEGTVWTAFTDPVRELIRE